MHMHRTARQASQMPPPDSCVILSASCLLQAIKFVRSILTKQNSARLCLRAMEVTLKATEVHMERVTWRGFPGHRSQSMAVAVRQGVQRRACA